MGEIGRDRTEYLYEMDWREILLIVRGYRRRNILQYQLQRMTTYGLFHLFSGKKNPPPPDKWMPLYFDKYKGQDKPMLSEKEVKEMQAEMADFKFG